MGKAFRRLQDRRAGRAGRTVGVHTLCLTSVAYLVELHAFLEKVVTPEQRDAFDPLIGEMRNLEECYRDFVGGKPRAAGRS